LEEQAALQAGMHEKAEEFKKTGAKIYQEVGSTTAGDSSGVIMRAAPKE